MFISKLVISLRVLLLFGCVLAGVGSLNAFERSVEKSKLTGVEQLQLKKSRERLSGVERVLLSHFEALTVGTDSSYIARGTYSAQGLEFDFSVIGRRPDMFRLVFRKGGKQYVVIHKEGTFWDSTMESESDGFDLKEARLMELEATFLMLTWAYESSGVSGLELVKGLEVINGRSCYRIVNTKLDYMTTEHFIDLEKGDEVARRGRFQIGESQHEVEILYQPTAAIGKSGDSWTQGYTMVVDGALHAEAKFESVKRDSGVGSWMFESGLK
ncbi:MAG: hypothetical protein ACSHYA_06235 [Opitutaceae bacterium]